MMKILLNGHLCTFIWLICLTVLFLYGQSAYAVDITYNLAESPWPTKQGDFKRTGRSPHVGILQKPAVEWVYEFPTNISATPVIGPSGEVYVSTFWNTEVFKQIGSGLAMPHVSIQDLTPITFLVI